MASANTWSPSARPHSRTDAQHWAWPVGVAFALVAALLGAVCWWVLGNGYVSSDALALSAKILVLRDAAGLRVEYLGFQYPQASVYLGTLLAALPVVTAGMVPYALDVLAIAGLFALAWHDVRHAQGNLWATALLALLLAHPFTLWAATSAQHQGLGLFAFYGLCRTFKNFAVPEPITYMRVAAWLSLLLFVDERALLLALALAPWLVLVAPRSVMREAPLAVYLVCYLPFGVFALGWMYLNWLFLHHPLPFLADPGAAAGSGLAQAAYLPWLREYGGQWLLPALALLVAGVAALPVLLLAVPLREGRWRDIAATVGTVVCAGMMATLWYFATTPMEFIVLLVPAAALVLYRLSPRQRPWALVLLAAGVASGWYVLPWQSTPPVQQWMAALQGPVTRPQSPEAALGRWLSVHRTPTVIDDGAGFAVIAHRGDARDLILPFSPRYKLALLNPGRTPPQIVVADPASEAGSRDAVSQRFPGLWSEGRPGYRLVYEQGPWRVWQRAP